MLDLKYLLKVLGQYAQRHYAQGHYAQGHYAQENYAQTEIMPNEIKLFEANSSNFFSGYYLKRFKYLLYGSVASLPSPSSNIEAWPYGTSLRFASLLHLGH